MVDRLILAVAVLVALLLAVPAVALAAGTVAVIVSVDGVGFPSARA